MLLGYLSLKQKYDYGKQESKSEILKLRTGLKRDIRLVIRKSGTENKIRIMAESRDKKLANKIVSQSLDILNRANV